MARSHEGVLRGRRTAVLIEEQYQELEVWVPCLRLKEAGARPASTPSPMTSRTPAPAIWTGKSSWMEIS